MVKEHVRYASFEWPEWEMREFPMMVYPLNKADPSKPTYVKSGKLKGRPIAGVIVQDQTELAEVLGMDPPEQEAAATPRAKKLVEGPGGAQRLESDEDVKAELLIEAIDLGLQPDKRWTAARIQEAIDAKRAELAEEDPVV